MRRTPVLVLARLPEPGRAKTRLVPVLGPEGAARLHARLVSRTVAVAAEAGPVTVWATPRIDDPWLWALADRHGAVLALQPDGDLGTRMAAALAEAVAAWGRALLVGSDLPTLDAAVLRAAARALDSAEAVMVPVEDGGYGLVGVRDAVPDLFTGIAWGGAEVAAQTRERATAAGVRLAELPPLWDVDRPADLERLAVTAPALLEGLRR